MMPEHSEARPESRQSMRIASIDALRGFIMFLMIFVNDLAGAPVTIVPSWMRHFHGESGMTFVDLVFPGFLFVVGMSLPLALERRSQLEPLWKTVLHICVRTISLLAIGIMMVNDESPAPRSPGWWPALWATLFYSAAILAFSTWRPAGADERSQGRCRKITLVVRAVGFVLLLVLAFTFRGADGANGVTEQRIITLRPFSIHTEWYGILGLIGWAYWVGALVWVVFRGHRTALLGAVVLLLCLYPADRHGAFNHFWLARYVGIGGTLGSQASITVAGLLLGSTLHAADLSSLGARIRFTLLFIGGFAAAALLLHGLYGIYKNSATPSWCLWSCAITAGLWLLFHLVCDREHPPRLARALAFAGSNVLLSYLISEMLPSALDLFQLGAGYARIAEQSLAAAIARSAICAVLILLLSASLNRRGFRLKL